MLKKAVLLFTIIVCFFHTFMPRGLAENTMIDDAVLLQTGEEFVEGSYIEFSKVIVYYDGTFFHVENHNKYPIRIICWVVGVKRTNDYELLGTAVFGAVDQDKFEAELQENGWAIPQSTNFVGAGETLVATLSVMDAYKISNIPNMESFDVDCDGYYDAVMIVYKQKNEKDITTFTNAPTSNVFKLKVDSFSLVD